MFTSEKKTKKRGSKRRGSKKNVQKSGGKNKQKEKKRGSKRKGSKDKAFSARQGCLTDVVDAIRAYRSAVNQKRMAMRIIGWKNNMGKKKDKAAPPLAALEFFIDEEELSRRVYPDLCFGWLYVTTPR